MRMCTRCGETVPLVNLNPADRKDICRRCLPLTVGDWALSAIQRVNLRKIDRSEESRAREMRA